MDIRKATRRALEDMQRWEYERQKQKQEQEHMEYERYKQMSQTNYPTTNLGAHTHTVSYPTTVATPTSKGQQYSLAEVQLVSGGMIGMTINASTKIADHLLKGMKETGFLHLRNEAESIVLRAEDVRAFKLTQLTTEG